MKKGRCEVVNYKKPIFAPFGTTAITMKILKHCLNYWQKIVADVGWVSAQRVTQPTNLNENVGAVSEERA